MEYQPVPIGSLVVGQRYYIVPKSRLQTAKLYTVVSSAFRYRKGIDIKPIPEAKKKTILLLSAVLASKGGGWSDVLTFNNFQNKDDEPSKDTRKNEEYLYFSFTPTPVPTVMGSTVTAADAAKTIGELSENVPASMREEGAAAEAVAGPGAAAAAPTVPELRTPMTPAVKKTTDELMNTLRLGEARVSISDILKRKNTPQLENLENRLLNYTHAVRILPSDYPLPPPQYYGVQTVNVFSPYGAIELLIGSPRFTADQKDRYIREMVALGADPSKALVTAILKYDTRILNLLLDLGADPNYVSEYKSTDGSQRFLTSPLLAAIPARITDLPSTWEAVQPFLQTLAQHRTFVMNEGDVLTRTNRNSLPDGTPVYETVAYITPKILGTFRERLAAVCRYSTLLGHDPNVLRQINKYANMLQGWISYLEEESVKQGPFLAEPGGPAYEEARARDHGTAIGTREEQHARNAAANETVRASLLPVKNMNAGGSRKHKRMNRRQSRRFHHG